MADSGTAGVEASSVFVTAPDGLKLHVRCYGPRLAPSLPVVCLPGLTRTAADFDDLAAALASNPEAPRRVLAIDYRGRGLSDYDRDPAQLQPRHRACRPPRGAHRARRRAGGVHRHLARRHPHHAAGQRPADRHRRRRAQRHRPGDRADRACADQELCRQAAAAQELRGRRRDLPPSVRPAFHQADRRRNGSAIRAAASRSSSTGSFRPTTCSSPRRWKASISTSRCRRCGRSSTASAACR